MCSWDKGVNQSEVVGTRTISVGHVGLMSRKQVQCRA